MIDRRQLNRDLLDTVEWLERNSDTTKFNPASKYAERMNSIDIEIMLYVAYVLELRGSAYDKWRDTSNL